MNWYKKAQYENLSQFELVKMIQKLNPIYLGFLDKERKNILSPEEKVSMEQTGNELNLLGDIKRKKVEEQKEPSEKLIEEGKPHEVLPMNFMDYHHTGNIEESAYKQYGTKEGVSWLGPIEKYPINFAKGKNNLGTVYRTLSDVRDKKKNLDSALGAFGEALKVFTFKKYPIMNKKVIFQIKLTKKRRGSITFLPRRSPSFLSFKTFAVFLPRFF